MKLRDFIKELQSIKEELQDKEVYVLSYNKMLVSPAIKFDLRVKYDILNKSKGNVNGVIISH